MTASKTFLLIAGLFSISHGLPQNFQCSRYCKEENNAFGYEPGKVYNYNYEGHVRSLINATKNDVVVDESGIKFRCSVDIYSLSTCEFAMQISRVFMEEYHVMNTVIEEYPPTDKFKELREQIELRPLHFSYHNGKISTICPDGDEIKEILAIKKGILSVFQNSLQGVQKDTLVYETDITGTCETLYKIISNENDETVVEKTKNLDACTHRMSHYLSWQTVPYATKSQARSLPLLRSTLSCLQVHNEDNILKTSSCEEKHVFQPFSNGDNGAMSLVNQKMTLQSVKANSKPMIKIPTNVRRTSLIYEQSPKERTDVDVTTVIDLFKELESKTSDGVEADVPVLFSKLVFYFQSLQEEHMLALYNRISQKQRKFYIDAISLLTTTSGIEVMKQLYQNEQVSKKQMDSWIISLSFMKNPDLDTIIAIQPLMKMNTTKQNTILAISSIIYRYCKEDPNCIDKRAISETIKEIELPLENNCVPSRQSDNNDILLSLKGIGNAGVTTSLSLLQKCYSNYDSPIELRLAAIAAHRRMSCTRNFNIDDFKNYFANPKENAEIRIASFLATMQCASYAVFAQVKDVLIKEETNQVGSFVWTYITNLQESSVKWKQGLRKLLENEFLRNKFNTDVRKYSRNYEVSAFFDSVGAGGAVESNVIFTSESYIPRSAMLNFTLDLFGETINVFEVGARIEGFEEIVENFFGPEGYFSDKSIKTFLENARNAHSEANEEIQKLGDDFRAQKILKKDPAGLLYANIFGNEFSYTHFNNLHDLIGEPILKENAVDLILNLFKENDIEYVKSFLFLDSSYQIPTILGFPLELAANGTSTLGLTVRGKLDLKDLWSYKVAIEGKIYPSASVQIIGTMSVDALFAKTGVQYVGSLNSNMYIDGHALIDAGKVADFKLNVPKKQMDIISASSEVFIVHNNEVFDIQEASDNIEDAKYCTQELFSKITGLELCYNMRYVNASQIQTAPYFPLTGSFRYALNVKKIDVFDSYQLHVQTQIEEQTFKPLYSMSLYLDTPNSLVDRKIKASCNLNLEKLSLNAKLESPFTSFEINSNLGNEMNKYSFQLETIYNNREMVSLQSSFNKNFAGETFRYDSQAKLNFRRKQIAAITGSLNYLHRGQYAANLKLEGVTSEAITIVGDLIHDPKSMSLHTTFSSKGFNGKMQSEISVLSDFLMISTNFNYTINSGRDENFSLMSIVKKVRNAPLLEDKLMIRLESTQAPIYNLHIDLHNQRKQWHYKNYGRLTIFKTTWETNQVLQFFKEKYMTDIDIHADLSCLENKIDYKAMVVYNTTKSSLHAHALFQLNMDERIEALLNYKNENSKEVVDVMFYYPKQTWLFNGLINRDNSENYFVLFDGYRKFEEEENKIISISGYYTNSSMDIIHDHKVNCTVDFPEMSDYLATPWIITASLQKSKDLFLSFTQLKTKGVLYASHVNWMKDTLSFVVQANDKQLFVLNAAKNELQWGILLVLNVYQHFEVSAKLMLPFEKFEMKFFWDKNRDENKKFTLVITTNSFKGIYKINMEYPNQKITAGFILLPTQVTMNVTWGIKVSQRIYFKVGNKIYDVGGIWFGELETPFQYLEKQEFSLKYYVVPKSFEVQSDVAWRRQSIHLLMSGSRSADNLAAVFQLNTTLAQISKIGAAMNHRRPLGNTYETDATFVYNSHQIDAKSTWKLEGVQILSDFMVKSPSDTIQPIGGYLGVNTLDRNSLVFEFQWQDKIINVVCKFKPDTSKIVINTPFEGIENTTFEYTVKAYANNVSVAVTVDLLKQYNNIDLKWSNLNESMVFFMDITSPVTGYYSLYFTHSTVSGILKDSFTIKGRGFKDIVKVKLEGEIISILEMNIATSLQLLEHKALFEINMENNPLLSSVKASWNNFNIESILFLSYESQQIESFTWSVNATNTNTADNSVIYVRYYHLLDKYNTYVQFPKGYLLENSLTMTPNYEIVKNRFELTTPDVTANFIYEHENLPTVFKQNLIAEVSKQLLNYTLIFDSLTHHQLNVRLDMPYQLHDLNRRILIESTASVLENEGNVNVLIDISNKEPIKIAAHVNFSSPVKEVGFQVKSNDDSLVVLATANLREKHGILTLSSATTGPYFSKKINAEFKSFYKLEDPKRSLNFDAVINRKHYNFEGSVTTGSAFKLDAILKQNYYKIANVEVSFSKLTGNAMFGYNFGSSYKKVRLIYTLNDSDDYELYTMLSSNIENIPKSMFNITYSRKDNKINLDLLFNEHSLSTSGSYSLERNNTNKIRFEKVYAKFFAFYKLGEVEKINLDVKVASQLETDSTSGKMQLAVETNLKKFENVELIAEYVENVGYEAWATYRHNENLYKIDLNNYISQDVFEISGKIETPKLGIVRIEVNNLKKDNEYTTQIILNVNEKLYSADVITSYVNPSDTATRFQVNMPTERYAGNFEIKFGDMSKLINLTLALPGEVYNRFTFAWDKDGSPQITSILQIDYIELVPQKLVIAYDLNSPNKSFSATHFDNVNITYHLVGKFSPQDINVRLDLNNEKDFIVLGGTHKFTSLRDFSVSYNIFKEGNKVKMELVNFFGDIYQTKIDISTYIRGWSRLTLESKLDKDKIRISFNVRNHRMSLVAKKMSPKGGEVLSVMFQGETLLEILSAAGQVTLTTSTRFGKYRFFIQYNQNPGIYVFTILKDRENLISLMLQNLSTNTEIDFKGKLIAPELIPSYSNLSLQLHADRDLSKSAQFRIYNSFNELFEVKWFTKRSPGDYSGYFKFNSKLKMLQNFDVYTILNYSEDIVFTTKFTLIDEYFALLVLPKKNHESKILLRYPCKDYNACELLFNVRPDYLDFHWTSPFVDWKNMSLLTTLKFDSNALFGELRSKKADKCFNFRFDVNILDDFVEGNLLLTTNTGYLVEYLNLNGRYVFYRSMHVKYATKHDEGVMRAHVNEESLKIYVINDNREICNITFMENNYGEEAYLGVTLNNLNIFYISRGKVDNRSHSQFLKAKSEFLLQFNGLVYYDLSAVDHQMIGGYFESNETYFLDKIFLNASIDFHSHFQIGKAAMTFRNRNMNDTNEAVWFINLSYPNTDLRVNFTRNEHVIEVNLNHDIDDFSINSSFNVTCGHRAVRLMMRGEIEDGQLKGDFALTTPIPSLNRIHMAAIVKRSPREYSLSNDLSWPNNFMKLKTSVISTLASKTLDVDFSSSFTEPIASFVEYKQNDKKVDFMFETSALDEWIKLKSEIVPWAVINGHLSTSFEGFRSCNVTSSMDQKEINIKVTNDGVSMEMKGEFVGNSGTYEMDMQVNYPNKTQEVAKVCLKLNNNNFNMSLQFKNDAIRMSGELDNNNYNLNFYSPYQFAKEVNLKGIYSNDVNVYSLVSDGNWNDLIINFSGTLNTVDAERVVLQFAGKAGEDYEGGMNFTCNIKKLQFVELVAFFPAREFLTYMTFELDNNEATILLKSPFDAFSSLTVKGSTEINEKLDVLITGNILGKQFVASNSGSMNSTDVIGRLYLNIPDMNNFFEIKLHVNKMFGFLNLNQNFQNDRNNITVDYRNDLGKFTSNYAMSGRMNVDHSLTVLYKDGPNVEYGFILDDIEIVEKILVLGQNASTELVAKIPYFGIKGAGFYLRKYLVSDTFKTGLYCNEFYANATVAVKIPSIESEIDAFVPYLGKLNGSALYTNDNNEIAVKTTFLQPETFQINSNMFVKKDASHIFAAIGDIFKLELQRADRLKFIFQTYTLMNLNMLDIQISNHSFYLKAASPVLEQKEVEIILTKFQDDSQCKQFKLYYTENRLHKYFASFIFENTDKYIIKANFGSNLTDLITFEAELKYRNYIESSVNLIAFGIDHRGNVTLNLNHPYVAKLDLISPSLTNNRLTVAIEITSLQTMIFLVSSGDQSLGNYILFQSVYQGKALIVNVDAPKFNYLKLLKLKLIWDFDTDNISCNNLKIESDVLGEIILQADFRLLDDLLDIETRFEIPFLENLESFYGKIYVPKEFRPRLEFILPNNLIYSLHFNHTINNDVIFIDAGYQCAKHISNILFDLSLKNREIETKVIIPYEPFNYFAISVKKRVYLINLNNREYSLVYDYRNDKLHKLFDFVFTTPFATFERASLNLEYKTGSDTLMKLAVFHPTLEKEALFLLTYENLMSFELTYKIHLPFVINDFNFVDIVIINRLNSKRIEKEYILRCTANTNDYRMFVNIEAVDNAGRKEMMLNVEMNEDILAAGFNLMGDSFSDFKISSVVKTPLEQLNNFRLVLESNTNFALLKHGNVLTLEYNDASIIDGSFDFGENTLALRAGNIWRPFSLEYKFIRNVDLDFAAKLVWDLRKPKESQIGAFLHLGHDLSSGVYLPNNTITFDALSKKDDNNETYYMKASWNENDVAVWSSVDTRSAFDHTNICVDHYIQLPFRKFQLTHNVSTALSTINSTLRLSWGEDPSSCLTFKNEKLPGKLTSTLVTSALDHNLVLTIDMSKFKELPSIARAEFKYSDNLDKLIQFEIFYNKIINTAFATQRNFIFKHPASKVDYELYFNSLRSSEFSNGSLVLKYRNFDSNIPESIKALVKVDHDKFGVSGEVETSKNSFNFKAASTSGEDSLGFLIRAKVNEKDPLHVECTYNYKQASPSVNFIASYGDSRRYILYAGLPNEREITAQLGNELYGKYSLDSLLTMKLNTSQLLWIKILWKKELYPQFYKAIFEEYNDLRFVIEATGKELIDVIDDDLGKEFIKDATDMKQRIVTYVLDERSKILDDIKNNTYSCFGESNYICKILAHSKVKEFIDMSFSPFRDLISLLKDTAEKAFSSMVTSLQHTCMIINEQIEKALKDIKNIKNIKIDAKDILKKGISDARKSLKQMETIAIKLLDDFDKYIGYVNVKIEEFFEPFLSILDDLVAYLEQRLAVLQMVILDILDTIQRYVYNLRETKEMLKVYAAYINWLEEIHLTDLLEPIGDVIEDILETLISDMKKVTEHYKPYLDALSEAVFGKYDGINQLPPIAEFREFANVCYQKTIWIWNYHNMTESMKSVIQRISSDIDDVLSFIELDDKSGDFENHFGLADYVVRPEVGLIEISQPLTFQWEAFNEPPSFQQHPLYQKIQRKVDQFVKVYKNRYDLIDGVESLVYDLAEPSIAPVTNNFAMIVGRSHFATFNNNYFNFVSNCSYLLASDFHMNSFSLVINYDQSGFSRSFEILTSGASIEISPNYTVLFDKKQIELPLLYNHVTITKENENIIVESTKGFKMNCNKHYDFCTIELSGWLFGKTAGLLGTLDNEENSDIALANGTKATNISEFTDSWKLQKQCVSTSIKTKEELQNASPLVTGLLSNLCSVFFSNKNSPLAECFDRIDPVPFMNMCVEDMDDKMESTMCSSIAAYRSRCKRANVHLDIPELCLHCPNDIGIREEIFDGHNPNSLDVVFVTQLDCFSGNYNVSLPVELSNSLVGKGYENSRYASVGFGGKTLTKPHVYTSGNQIWSTGEELMVKYKHNSTKWNSRKYKAVDAVKYASNMNFRPGVPKLFVLSLCDVTTEMENAPEIYNMLGEKDITLHVLKPKPFGNFSFEIGIDGNNDVFSKAKTNSSADMIISKLDDVYSGLALSTNGTIFDFDAVLTDAEVASVWAEFVTKNVKRSPCQKCKCMTDNEGVGRLECSRCLTPAVKQFLNEYEANNKMRFSDSDFSVD